MTHYQIESDDIEVFCTKANDWVDAPVDTSDTGPACAICSFCNTLLVDDDKTVVPHHVHLGSQWYCRGVWGMLTNVDQHGYFCSECKTEFTLTEKGQSNGVGHIT